ncbi:MAG: hypothetical protein GY707_05185 [Desulfobacteraceae bacterium]|nr:hypothetical protein [Desulfobacteraceae bacterium]
MDLKSLIVEKTEIEVEHPALDGFFVTVSYISKDRMKKLLDRATTTKFNRKTHKPEEEVDNDVFLALYSKALIKGWKGLKYSYLEELLPVDLSSVEDTEAEVEYKEENALDLLKTSTDFDNWLSSVVSDITVFNKAN